ncbi:GspE/PulE family protein, partial [Patescibacteria group bacterium]|nr:GspE/PulE family protein [Patescibacteria group bacterium]
ILAEKGIAEKEILEAKSKVFGVPAVALGGKKVAFEVLKNVPEESARFYKFVPLSQEENILQVGMVNPDDVKAQNALKFIANRLNITVKIFLISEADFESIIEEYKSIGGEVTHALSEFEIEQGEEKIAAPKIVTQEKGQFVEEAPITKMVAVILRHAVEGKASDIHIEPVQDKLRVRFRVDGVLYTSLLLPVAVHNAIVSRIKVMTNMKIDENRVPQDGRFHARVLDKEIDFRVSTFPTSFGEKVAIRILDPEIGIKTLPDLGLEGRNLRVVEENIKKPYGMVLITGPTGSGKSTTLYALLQILNQEGKNIVSLEDPIEYYLAGVNQSQVHPEINYDFASGLRSIVRQDPDIIMVGEIRDKETAQLAVHAALTGHLVLSTLHTNNAIGVIPRLIDMGVDPFLIPSTLILAMGQRLVRKLCEESRKELAIDGRAKEIILEELGKLPESYKKEFAPGSFTRVFEGEVSSSCPKGTRGRIGVFEVLAMTKELEKIILEGPSESKIASEAVRQNMITMRQDGILKVLHGIIGLNELMEVI